MSAVEMSQVAFARRSDTDPAIPSDVDSFNKAAHGAITPNDALTTAMGAIVAYFPSEVNVLYTAILAAIATSQSNSLSGQWITFYALLVTSPLVVWLLYAARCRADNKPLPSAPKVWPKLEMVFSVIGFAVWAAALPDSPFTEITNYSTALAGVMVIVVTAVLGLIAPVFGREITTG